MSAHATNRPSGLHPNAKATAEMGNTIEMPIRAQCCRVPPLERCRPARRVEVHRGDRVAALGELRGNQLARPREIDEPWSRVRRRQVVQQGLPSEDEQPSRIGVQRDLVSKPGRELGGRRKLERKAGAQLPSIERDDFDGPGARTDAGPHRHGGPRRIERDEPDAGKDAGDSCLRRQIERDGARGGLRDQGPVVEERAARHRRARAGAHRRREHPVAYSPHSQRSKDVEPADRRAVGRERQLHGVAGTRSRNRQPRHGRYLNRLHGPHPKRRYRLHGS